MKFACFNCRKVFNKPTGKLEQDVLSGQKEWTPPPYECSGCGALLHATGEEFRPPSRRVIDQWRKAELLIRSGFLFHRGVGPYPETLSEAQAFVRQHKMPRNVSEAMKMAKERKIPKTCEARAGKRQRS